MFRIMVVDDEATHLLNLIGAIRTLKPAYLIFNAKDGVQALEIMGAFDVDLLITDIQMPNMDGLQLIERMKARKPELLTAILSGYGEFEYAKKAIALGVDGYLLKPVDEEELLELLDELEWKVKLRQASERSQRDLLNNIEKLKIDRIEREIEGFAMGFMEDRDAKKFAEFFGGIEGGLVLMLKPKGHWTDDRIAEWKVQLRYLVKQWGEAMTFQSLYLDGAIVSILALRAPVEEGFFAQLQAFSLAFSGEEGNLFGVSLYFDDLFKWISTAMKQASEACEYAFFRPGRTVYRYHPDHAMEPLIKGRSGLPLEETERLLMMGEADRAADALITHAMDYIVRYRPYPSKFKEVLLFCFWKMCSAINGAPEEEDLHGVVANMDQLISNSANWTELQAIIRNGCTLYCELIKNRRRATSGDTMERAAQILREQYDRNWSLHEIADRVHFNRTYFSSLFKQHFGIGYSDYLNDVRMERAAEQLIRSNVQVGRLAQKIGFHDATYFIKAFKKKYGVTPNEYRKAHKP